MYSGTFLNHQEITVVHGIEYDGAKYAIFGGSSGLKCVSYERNSGLLLYISVSNGDPFGVLNYIIPSVIARTFGIVGFEITKYSELSMKLVNYIPGRNSLSFMNMVNLSDNFIIVIFVNAKSIKVNWKLYLNMKIKKIGNYKIIE